MSNRSNALESAVLGLQAGQRSASVVLRTELEDAELDAVSSPAASETEKVAP
jgi:hypothetical protein